MNDANPLLAELLETSAAGYAAAASALLQQSPDFGGEIAGNAAEWKAHLQQRILELAAAVRIDQPDVFARRVRWLRKAVSARGTDERALRAALESLGAALDQELPEPLRTSVRPHLKLALESFDAAIEPEAEALDSSDPLGRLGLEYLTACLEARTDEARQLILNAVPTEVSPPDVIARVLVPAQREIGQLWHSGSASIGEERLVSETTREVLALILDRHAPTADPNRTLLAAAVAGNAHDIGLRAVTALFRLAGWRTLLLGADVPSGEIAKAAQSFDVSLVVLSATLTTQIGTLAEAIRLIKQADEPPPVLIGGLALEDSGGLWRELGADAYAPGIAGAVDIGSKLVGGRS